MSGIISSYQPILQSYNCLWFVGSEVKGVIWWSSGKRINCSVFTKYLDRVSNDLFIKILNLRLQFHHLASHAVYLHHINAGFLL